MPARQETQPSVDHVERSNRPSFRAREQSGGMLSIVGIAMAALGAAVCVVVELVPSVGEQLARVQGWSLGGASLIVGGVVVASLAAVRKSLAAALDREDDSLIVEQVAADLVDVRASLQEMHASHTSVSDELRMLQSAVASVAEAQRMSAQAAAVPQGNATADEAIFRLAASLDQLGARMEQRLKSQYGAMQDSLEEMNRVVVSVRQNMESLIENGSTSASAAAPLAQPTPLGLLDSLDDPCATPSAAPELALRAAQPSAQAPVDPWSSAAPYDGDAVEVHIDATPTDKLAELQALLSDDDVRAALETMRRAAGR